MYNNDSFDSNFALASCFAALIKLEQLVSIYFIQDYSSRCGSKWKSLSRLWKDVSEIATTMFEGPEHQYCIMILMLCVATCSETGILSVS